MVKNGHGNYMVDVIGFNHISGERLLGIDAKDATASAYHDITVPAAGKYRLWVRYEYPAFCETRFRVAIEQGGKQLLDHVMGTKESPRYAFGDPKPKAQHDPAVGAGGADGRRPSRRPPSPPARRASTSSARPSRRRRASPPAGTSTWST